MSLCATWGQNVVTKTGGVLVALLLVFHRTSNLVVVGGSVASLPQDLQSCRRVGGSVASLPQDLQSCRRVGACFPQDL